MNNAISKYRNHLSILLIKEKIRNPASFSFKEAFLSDIEKELKNLNTKIASTFGNIPPKILRASKESCYETLKVADVSPVFKRDDLLKMKSYRPVSVLPVVSKIFERVLHKQMSHAG